jgi:hypothetical protein
MYRERDVIPVLDPEQRELWQKVLPRLLEALGRLKPLQNGGLEAKLLSGGKNEQGG